MTAPSRKTAPAPSPDLVPVKRALISVSDKSGLAGFRHGAFLARGIEILSTGGTAKALARGRYHHHRCLRMDGLSLKSWMAA
jgi:hypothetical protein